MRYKGGSPPLMICTARCAAMVYQACGLDKKIPRTLFSEFFGGEGGIYEPRGFLGKPQHGFSFAASVGAPLSEKPSREVRRLFRFDEAHAMQWVKSNHLLSQRKKDALRHPLRCERTAKRCINVGKNSKKVCDFALLTTRQIGICFIVFCLQ